MKSGFKGSELVALMAFVVLLWLLVGCWNVAEKEVVPVVIGDDGKYEFLSVEELPRLDGLSDLFLRPDGTRISSVDDWEDQRVYLRGMLEHYLYGKLPPLPDVEDVQVKTTREQSILRGDAVLVYQSLTWGDGLRVDIRVTYPLGHDPLPVVMRLDHVEGYEHRPQVEDEMLREGRYAFVTVSRRFLAPDEAESHDVPMLDRFSKESGLGAIALWAYGAMVVMNHLEKMDELDTKRVVITGHSRDGKAALAAAALDDRFAVVVPNGSGLGGAGSFHVQGSGAESLEGMVTAFPHWFSPRLAEFAGGNERRLPFDMHVAHALIAPRAVLMTEAAEDLWANPKGTYANVVAAREVYQFLGEDERRLTMVMRPGEHQHTYRDWRALIAFADFVFFGKMPSESGFSDIELFAEQKF